MEVFKAVADDPTIGTAIDIDLQNKVNKGEITHEQAVQQKQDIDNAAGVLKSIPDREVLITDQRKEKL